MPPLERVAGKDEGEEHERKVPPLTVQQLLDKWVQASGGAAAWGKLKTRTSKETVEFAGPRHACRCRRRRCMAAPERWHATLTMKQGTFEQGWDGKTGWRKFGGHAMPLESIAEVRREAQFAPPLTMAKLLTGAQGRRRCSRSARARRTSSTGVRASCACACGSTRRRVCSRA